jgi:hypothetical protein
MPPLILKRASASRSSGEWRDDDYDVLENGVVIGRIFKVLVAPEAAPGCGRVATVGTYVGRHMDMSRPREAAMAAFAKSWRRNVS